MSMDAFRANLTSALARFTILAVCLTTGSVAHAADLTTGIDVCDNVGVTAKAGPSRYLPDQKILEFPLVFAPGIGWYRMVLQEAAGTNFEFEIKELGPTCEKQVSPASIFPQAQTLFAPAVEVTDASGVVSKFDLQLVLQSSSGRLVPSQVVSSGVASSVYLPVVSAAPAADNPVNAIDVLKSRVARQVAASTIEAVQLDKAVGLYPAGFIVPLTRIRGTRIGNVEAGCNSRHLHGGPAFFDNAGPYSDPNPNGCGYGKIVVVQADTIDPGVINASVPAGTDYCGPDITSVFFARLKLMAARLAALPDSERGVFDGTLFLARNGVSMDFVTGSLKDPAANAVCPSAKCSGVQHTSTFTLCGQCMISHVDNDIEFGFVAQLLDVPWAIQSAGGHTWDLLQRAAFDPLASQISYRVGNDLADKLRTTPGATDAQLCATLAGTRLIGYEGVLSLARVHESTKVYADELKQFGKSSCTPCPFGCPEAIVLKDFSTQNWMLDGGGTADYVPR